MRGIVSISMKIITFNIRGLGGLVKEKGDPESGSGAKARLFVHPGD